MGTTTASRRRNSLPDRALTARRCVTAERPASCECGQALDTCPARSCPRCGAHVVAAPAVRRPPCPAGWNP
jgi:hypothetical protein